MAAAFGLASALSVVVLGDESGYTLTENQQMKLAAMEGMWHTEPAPAGLTLFGLPSSDGHPTRYEIKVPYVLGLIATRSLTGQVTGMTELVAPAHLRPELAEEVAQTALACYEAVGCRGFGRVDMIIDADERIWVLEIDPIPGMTDTSLLPKAAMAAGLSFDEVVERVLSEASLGG